MGTFWLFLCATSPAALKIKALLGCLSGGSVSVYVSDKDSDWQWKSPFFQERCAWIISFQDFTLRSAGDHPSKGNKCQLRAAFKALPNHSLTSRCQLLRQTSVGHILQTAGLLCCIAGPSTQTHQQVAYMAFKKEEFTLKKENAEALTMSSSPTVHINI